jgi:heme/copper-type cytochrome/quinol oxidase subunit 2
MVTDVLLTAIFFGVYVLLLWFVARLRSSRPAQTAPLG